MTTPDDIFRDGIPTKDDVPSDAYAVILRCKVRSDDLAYEAEQMVSAQSIRATTIDIVDHLAGKMRDNLESRLEGRDELPDVTFCWRPIYPTMEGR